MRQSTRSVSAPAAAPRRRKDATLMAVALTSCSISALALSYDPAQARQRDRDAEPAPVAAKSVEKKPVNLGPLIAVVSKGGQNVTIYNDDGRVMRASVSTGQSDHPTPLGIFSVIAKERMHYSNLYGDAPMPFMQRITWSGVALHAGYLPGYPASHGCIRMPPSFAADLYGKTRVGMRVIITKNDPTPVAFSHPNLFSPKLDAIPGTAADNSTGSGSVVLTSSAEGTAQATPLKLSEWLKAREDAKVAAAIAATRAVKEAQSVRADADMKSERRAELAKKIHSLGLLADELGDKIDQTSRVIEVARTPEAATRLEVVKQGLEDKRLQAVGDMEAARAEDDDRAGETEKAVAAADAADAAREKAVLAAREAAHSTEPVTVFISRKTRKLYVRQAFTPVFDAPVSFSDASQPVGTFVYTAMRFDDASSTVAWKVVSAVTDAAALKPEHASTSSAKHKKDAASEPVLTGLEKQWPITATAALDRIEIAADVRDKVASLLTPGSSLIVSDEPISNETGKGTDFVILTH